MIDMVHIIHSTLSEIIRLSVWHDGSC